MVSAFAPEIINDAWAVAPFYVQAVACRGRGRGWVLAGLANASRFYAGVPVPAANAQGTDVVSQRLRRGLAAIATVADGDCGLDVSCMAEGRPRDLSTRITLRGEMRNFMISVAGDPRWHAIWRVCQEHIAPPARVEAGQSAAAAGGAAPVAPAEAGKSAAAAGGAPPTAPAEAEKSAAAAGGAAPAAPAEAGKAAAATGGAHPAAPAEGGKSGVARGGATPAAPAEAEAMPSGGTAAPCAAFSVPVAPAAASSESTAAASNHQLVPVVAAAATAAHSSPQASAAAETGEPQEWLAAVRWVAESD